MLRKPDGLKVCLAGILAMALAGMAADYKIQPAGSSDTKRGADLPEVELRGMMACLPEEMHEFHGTGRPALRLDAGWLLARSLQVPSCIMAAAPLLCHQLI